MSAAAASDISPLLLPPSYIYPPCALALVLFCAVQAVSVRNAGRTGGGARLSERLPLRMMSGRLLLSRFSVSCASRRASRVACRVGRVQEGEAEGGGHGVR